MLDQQTGPFKKQNKLVCFVTLVGCDPQYIQVYRNMLLEEKMHPVTYQYLSVMASNISTFELIHSAHTNTVEFFVTLYSWANAAT